MAVPANRGERSLQNHHREACEILWQHWMAGEVLERLPSNLRPVTRADGYAIQAGFEGHSAHPRAGWKIAATSAAGQAHINVDGPIAGRLLAERLHEDGSRRSLAGNRMRVCEPEFAFRLGADLAPRDEPYSVSEVMEQVADLHLTLELPDSRFADFTRVGGPSLIADNACAHELIVGPRVTADWRALDLAAHPVVARFGQGHIREGSGANVLGDPRVALTWLVNEVSGLGITIAAGELVTTGTCMVPVEVAPGDSVVADFGPLGKIGVVLENEGSNVGRMKGGRRQADGRAG
jgi:2-keto-4-pentenoate hydratase